MIVKKRKGGQTAKDAENLPAAGAEDTAPSQVSDTASTTATIPYQEYWSGVVPNGGMMRRTSGTFGIGPPMVGDPVPITVLRGTQRHPITSSIPLIGMPTTNRNAPILPNPLK